VQDTIFYDEKGLGINENKIVLNPMVFELESDSRFDHLWK